MRKSVAAMPIIVGIIRLLPLSGVLGAERLAGQYGLGGYNAGVARVVAADWAALACLVVGACAAAPASRAARAAGPGSGSVEQEER